MNKSGSTRKRNKRPAPKRGHRRGDGERLVGGPEVTDTWRQNALDAMRAGGITHAVLAKQIGCSPAMVGHVLRGWVGASQFVLPMSEALGIDPPQVEITDEAMARALKAFRTIQEHATQPDDVRLVLAFLESQAYRVRPPAR